MLARRDYSNSQVDQPPVIFFLDFLNFPRMQWNRGTGQSHCFPCCGRHVLPDVRKQAEPQNIVSVAAAIDLPLESPIAWIFFPLKVTFIFSPGFAQPQIFTGMSRCNTIPLLTKEGSLTSEKAAKLSRRKKIFFIEVKIVVLR